MATIVLFATAVVVSAESGAILELSSSRCVLRDHLEAVGWGSPGCPGTSQGSLMTFSSEAV